MNKSRLIALTMLAATAGNAANAQNTPASQMEKLDRGVVSIPAADGQGRFVSWRFFGTDPDNTTFDLQRGEDVIARNIIDRTSYKDTNGMGFSEYRVITKVKGIPVDTSDVALTFDNFYKQLPLDRPAEGKTPSGESYTYSPNDCSAADVDGDGQYEIILKWDPSNSKDNSHSGYTGNVLIDCYKLDGTKMWRVDLGKNIRAGAHYTQFQVFDYDGDGKAEMICKTAPGSMDNNHKYVNQVADDTAIKGANNNADHRNSSGKITGGQEYLTVFDAVTGEAVHTVFYNPNRAFGLGGAPAWGDWGYPGKVDKDYANRGQRYLACTAYLDGPDANPSVVMVRGYYTKAYLWAVDYKDKKLVTRWLHASVSEGKVELTDAQGNKTSKTYTKNTRADNKGSKTAYGNGNHNMTLADVDGDGRDEIIWGSCAVDDNGELLYATGYGHGDAIHMGDIVPENPGLEVFQVHEGSPYGHDVHDAATGKILYYQDGGGDNGRGMCADVDAEHRGWEFWSSNFGNIYTADGYKSFGNKPSPTNARLYWDGDIQDELYDDKRIEKWNGKGTTRLETLYNYCSSQDCNSTKHSPNLIADLFGDWREELVLWDSSNGANLNIFTTNIPTDVRLATLMHDHTYRMAVAWQNNAYNQPPHVGYNMYNSLTTRYANMGKGEMEQTVLLGDTIVDIELKWINCANPSLLKSVAPDGTEKPGSAVDGFTWKRDIYINKNITLKGKPAMAGDYLFIMKSGKNIADGSQQEDTIKIHCIDPTGINNTTTANCNGRWMRATVSGNNIVMKLNMNSAQTIRISVYNAAGQKVYADNVPTEANATLTIPALGEKATGMYVVKVESKEGTLGEKLMK